MCGPVAQQCDLGMGFGSTWKTKKLVVTGSLGSHTTDRFDGDGTLPYVALRCLALTTVNRFLLRRKPRGFCEIQTSLTLPCVCRVGDRSENENHPTCVCRRRNKTEVPPASVFSRHVCVVLYRTASRAPPLPPASTPTLATCSLCMAWRC